MRKIKRKQYVLFCVRLHFSTTISVVLKRKRTQNKRIDQGPGNRPWSPTTRQTF